MGFFRRRTAIDTRVGANSSETEERACEGTGPRSACNGRERPNTHHNHNSNSTTVVMRRSAVFVVAVALLGLSLASVRAAPEAEAEKPVNEWEAIEAMQLDVDTFEEEIAKHDISAVFFYAPWCGHCKNAKPHWAAAKDKLAEDGIPIFAVNADKAENRPLSTKYGVQGFPTIFIFRKSVGFDKPTNYEGGRTTEGFVAGIKAYAGPASTYLDQADETLISPKREGYDHTKVTVIAFVDKKDSDYQKAFVEAADMIRMDGTFYHTDNYEIAKVVHADLEVKPNTVLLFRHFDGHIAKSETIGSATSIVTFIDQNYVAPFLSFSDMSSAISSRVYQGVNKYNVFVHAAETEKEKVKAWASKLPERFSSLIAPAIVFDPKGETSRIKDYFGMDDSLEVSIAMVDLRDSKKKYVMQKSATEENSVVFIEAVRDGTVAPHIKSEPVPEANDEAVKVVVGKTFEEVVLGGKNVMFEVYAPWCGHCKALAPVYTELGEALKEDEEVIVAKLDGTQNDILDDRFDVRGYPALFFMNSEGKVEAYSGQRSKDDMLKYIEENKTPVAADVLKKAAGAAGTDEL